MALAKPAGAHDWYDRDCCHNLDCAPVDKAESSGYATAFSFWPNGMTVTTRVGTVFVPEDFPRRQSKDGRIHVCMRPGATGAMQLICVYMPPNS